MYECNAKCGKEVRVYGSQYCPECHQKYLMANFSLRFFPALQAPHRSLDGEEVLLLNTCDGYHLAFVRFYTDGVFEGFSNFNEDQWYKPGESFQAWAKLPDVVKELIPIIGEGD